MPRLQEKKPSLFAERLMLLRKARQFTQVELAEKIGVTKSAVAYYEASAKNPRLETLKRLADFFDVAPEYFMVKNIEQPKKPGPLSRIDKLAERAGKLSPHRQKMFCNIMEATLENMV